MLLVMIYLLHHIGIRGLAIARVCYGAVSLLVYVPLLHRFDVKTGDVPATKPLAVPCDLQERVKL